MAKLFAMYQQPKGPAAFDSYYFNTQLPLAKTVPGLRSYEVTRGDVMGMGGPRRSSRTEKTAPKRPRATG